MLKSVRGLASTLILAGATLVSQAQSPPPPPDAPPQMNVPQHAALNPKLATLFIVGDSTASNGPDLGWGDHLAHSFDTTKINVANRAHAGRSSRSYMVEGAWDKVLAEIKPGDYVMLQWGHNDGGDLGGAKPRGSLHGLGEETQDVPQTVGVMAGKTETLHLWLVQPQIHCRYSSEGSDADDAFLDRAEHLEARCEWRPPVATWYGRLRQDGAADRGDGAHRLHRHGCGRMGSTASSRT